MNRRERDLNDKIRNNVFVYSKFLVLATIIYTGQMSDLITPDNPLFMPSAFRRHFFPWPADQHGEVKMIKRDARVLIIEKVKGVFLVYGEWYSAGQKCRGLVCKVRRMDGIFIRCHPFTGLPLSAHKSLQEAAVHGLTADHPRASRYPENN